jgi:hypothetical protein
MTAPGTEKTLVPTPRSEQKFLEVPVEVAAEFIAASKVAATRRAYRSDWRDFARVHRSKEPGVLRG